MIITIKLPKEQLTVISKNILSEFNQQITLFTNINNSGNIKNLIIDYYKCLKQLVEYICTQTIDTDTVLHIKHNLTAIMNNILEDSQNINDKVYLEMGEMVKDTYNTVDYLYNELTIM